MVFGVLYLITHARGRLGVLIKVDVPENQTDLTFLFSKGAGEYDKN